MNSFSARPINISDIRLEEFEVLTALLGLPDSKDVNRYAEALSYYIDNGCNFYNVKYRFTDDGSNLHKPDNYYKLQIWNLLTNFSGLENRRLVELFTLALEIIRKSHFIES